MLYTTLFSLTALTVNVLGRPQPQTGQALGDITIAPGTNASVGAREDLSIECTIEKPEKRPHTNDCVNALIRLPFTPQIIDFEHGSNPETVPLKSPFGRCLITIDTRNGKKSDKASWLYTLTMGSLLMNTCKYTFAQVSRTGGAIIFGQNGDLVMTITKLPSPDANGNLTYDDDDPEPAHNPELQALLAQPEQIPVAASNLQTSKH